MHVAAAARQRLRSAGSHELCQLAVGRSSAALRLLVCDFFRLRVAALAHATCHVSHASPAGFLPHVPPPHDAGALLAGKLAQWVARRWTEYASGVRQRRKELQARMDSATSYKEWAQAAQEVRHGWPAEA